MAHHLYVNASARLYQCPTEPLVSNATSYTFHRTFFPYYAPSPLVDLPSLANELGIKRVLLKYEGSRFGLPAFKILGASWAIGVILARKLNVGIEGLTIEKLAELTKEKSVQPVLYSATDGNHGRAVARIARLLGLRSRIYVPKLVSETSQSAIRSEGAEVLVVEGDYDYAVELCAKEAARLGDDALLIQDTAWDGYKEIPNLIVQGYTTIFQEIDSQLIALGLESPSLVAVPVGVGSLAHSALQHYRRSNTTSARPSILAVEPTLAGCLHASLRAGRSVIVETEHNTMPGLTCGTVSASALQDLLGGVDLSVLVNDDEVKGAVQDLEVSGVAAGPCGAASLAGVRVLKEDHNTTLRGDMVVVLICTEGRGASP